MYSSGMHFRSNLLSHSFASKWWRGKLCSVQVRIIWQLYAKISCPRTRNIDTEASKASEAWDMLLISDKDVLIFLFELFRYMRITMDKMSIKSAESLMDSCPYPCYCSWAVQGLQYLFLLYSSRQAQQSMPPCRTLRHLQRPPLIPRRYQYVGGFQ